MFSEYEMPDTKKNAFLPLYVLSLMAFNGSFFSLVNQEHKHLMLNHYIEAANLAGELDIAKFTSRGVS